MKYYRGHRVKDIVVWTLTIGFFGSFIGYVIDRSPDFCCIPIYLSVFTMIVFLMGFYCGASLPRPHNENPQYD